MKNTVLLVLLFTTTASANDGWTMIAGMEHSTGKYGNAESTDIVFYPVTARYQQGRGVASLTLTHVRMTSPSNVLPQSGRNPFSMTRQSGTQRRTIEGPGDVVATGTWNLIENLSDGWLLDITGKVKFGTADSAKGLGTGENDYSLQMDAVRRTGDGMLFGSLGGRRMGDPDGTDLKNPWFASLGTSFPLSTTVQASVGYDFRQRITEDNEPLRELTVFMTWTMFRDLRLQGYLLRGFSTGSPDHGTGAILSWRF